jgi:hypothetical protein
MCHDLLFRIPIEIPRNSFQKNTILVRFYQLLGDPNYRWGVPKIGYPQINPQIIHFGRWDVPL